MTAVCHKKALALFLNSSTPRAIREWFPEPCYGILAAFFVPASPAYLSTRPSLCQSLHRAVGSTP
jgi:hypothetical protein